jgi:hypothetical protein
VRPVRQLITAHPATEGRARAESASPTRHRIGRIDLTPPLLRLLCGILPLAHPHPPPHPASEPTSALAKAALAVHFADPFASPQRCWRAADSARGKQHRPRRPACLAQPRNESHARQRAHTLAACLRAAPPCEVRPRAPPQHCARRERAAALLLICLAAPPTAKARPPSHFVPAITHKVPSRRLALLACSLGEKGSSRTRLPVPCRGTPSSLSTLPGPRRVRR